MFCSVLVGELWRGVGIREGFLEKVTSNLSYQGRIRGMSFGKEAVSDMVRDRAPQTGKMPSQYYPLRARLCAKL